MDATAPGYDIGFAAALWQRILRTDTKKLFGSAYSRILDREGGIDIAQPGFVGREFNGLVFLSMNPGNGSKGGRGESDLKQYPLLHRLEDADPNELGPAFQQLNDLLAEIMPGWRIYRNLVDRILKGSGIRVSQIAYLTLLQWRTDGSHALRPFYDACWHAHTREQLDFLNPRLVVVLGKGASEVFGKYQYGAPHDFVPRSRGDYRVTADGQKAIERICSTLNGKW